MKTTNTDQTENQGEKKMATAEVKAPMTRQAQAIIELKHDIGPDAFLWVHDSGDVILWPDEANSELDDGANAVKRWQVDRATVNALIDSGECSEVA